MKTDRETIQSCFQSEPPAIPKIKIAENLMIKMGWFLPKETR